MRQQLNPGRHVRHYTVKHRPIYS